MAHSRTVPRQAERQRAEDGLGTGVGYLGVSVYLCLCASACIYLAFHVQLFHLST